MKHDPPAELQRLVASFLTREHQMREDPADQLAAEVAKRFLSCVDEGDSHFELLKVTLQWKALCERVTRGDISLSGARPSWMLLVGVLRWLDGMRPFHQAGATHAPGGAEVVIDHVEATACMALWRQELEAEPYSQQDTLAALLQRVNDILGETKFGTIDKARLGSAMEHLQRLGCLTTRAGWHRLRDEMKYQVPEE